MCRNLIRQNAILAIAVCCCFTVSATTLEVPTQHATIAAENEAAVDGDIITIGAGTYLVDKGAPLVVDKAITLRGVD